MCAQWRNNRVVSWMEEGKGGEAKVGRTMEENPTVQCPFHDASALMEERRHHAPLLLLLLSGLTPIHTPSLTLVLMGMRKILHRIRERERGEERITMHTHKVYIQCFLLPLYPTPSHGGMEGDVNAHPSLP